MPKKLAVCVLLVFIALLVVIPVGSAGAGRIVVGPSWCYVVIDYFEVDVTGHLIVTPTGHLGGELHCW